MSTTTLRIISSMATKPLLADLVQMFKAHAPQYEVLVESVGGVDAAKRVQAGEAFDCVVLASNAIDKLLADGKLVTGSRVDLVHSGVAVAVPAGAEQPDISTEAALKAAILAARTLGYSTGPSGVQLAQQFDNWGITEQIKDRIVQAPPGVPVGVLARPGRGVRGRTSVAARVFSGERVGRGEALRLRDAPVWCFVNLPMDGSSSSEIRARGDWRR